MNRRHLGRSGIEVSAIGLGCWAIGGPFGREGEQFGWGEVDDAESVRAIQRGIEGGVTFFDTANVYGAGHSETVLGGALRGRRDQVVIATKWGMTFDERTREVGEHDGGAASLRGFAEGSLRRLGTDYIDLYQLHINELPVDQALDLIPTLAELVAEGKVRAYGWSTDHPERAREFAAAGEHVASMQFDMSVLRDAAGMVEVCEELGLGGIVRGPLAMGLLSGKYHDGRAAGASDVRSQGLGWMTYFDGDGRGAAEWLAAVDEIREILTGGGRTLVQGALAWLWARSETLVPIPGFRTERQVAEIVGALEHGPLSEAEFAEVEKRLR